MGTTEIITAYDFPPIPYRNFDWSAIRFDHGDLIGYGSTETEAINDLINQEKEA